MSLMESAMYSEDGIFVANAAVAGNQSDPALAQLTNGNVIIAWRSDQGDGAGSAIKAQIVTAYGDRIGLEFLVNTTAAGNQGDPVVTALASGNFLIVWTGPEIHAQLFAADGSKIGAEFVANSTTLNNQFDPTVEALSSGGFVISYQSDVGGADSLRARVFDSNGAPLAADFVVPTSPDPASLPVISNDFVEQEVSALAGGGFLVTWMMSRTVSDPDFVGPGNPGGERPEDSIRGRLFAADGTPVGSEFSISTGTKQNLDDPAIVALSSGGFLVIWYRFGIDGGTEARFLDSAGNPVGDPFLLVSRDVGEAPEATALPQGGFLLSLFDDGERVFQIYDDSGQPVGDAYRATWDGSREVLLALADGSVFAAVAADDNGAVGDDIFVHKLRLPITLTGGPGDDHHIVNHPGDVVIEAPGGGYDVVFTSVSYRLSEDSEIEGLSTIDWNATTPINLTGNGLNNYLIGNAGANRLDGGGGGDIMYGREGNDIYFVDQAGDRAFESPGGGTDIVYTSVSYTLATTTDVENLVTRDWAATNAINLTGNHLANYMIGNDGANQMDGRAGADVMIGRAGNDKYLVDNAGDKVFESAGGGYDVVFTGVSVALTNDQEIEGLSSIDWNATTALNLTGNAAANYLIGNAGANVLDGKGGNDVLQGREGADAFAFTTALGANNVDNILDFSAADDTIRLENNGVFITLGDGALAPGVFALGTAAQDADDRIIYDQATGRLFFDADGTAGDAVVVHFATLQGAPGISANDFTVI